MRVLLFEHLTGGGTLASPVAGEQVDSLFREGLAMLRTMAADLACSPGVELTVQLDNRVQDPGLAGCHTCLVGGVDQEINSFRQLAASADWTVVIAPEFDGLLYRRCRTVEQAGGRLLGPSAETVALLSDKLRTASLHAAADVPTPKTRPLGECLAITRELKSPAVLKPRFGAGSQDVHLIESLDGFAHNPSDNWIVQDYHAGQALSVAALCGPQQTALLPAITQRLSDDGRFQYLGGQLPVSELKEERAHRLVQAAIACLPRLTGYVGFDLVLGNDTHGSEDVLIEINPRLTTSYVGLRAAAKQNLPAAMIDIAAGKTTELSFSREPIEFLADGSI